MDILQKNVDIRLLSNFKTPAKTKYYFEIHSEKDAEKLYEIFQYAMENNLQTLIIWWGTNMLFAFDVFSWIVIKNCLEWWTYNPEAKILSAFSSEMIRNIAESLEEDFDQPLWHRFIWLPGSIWWAVFWNAWCFWLETENNFVSAKVVNLFSWKVEILEKKGMNFEYRSSILKKEEWKYFLISCQFDLSTKIEKYHSDVDNIYFREHKQPAWNTCGSFFKNPSVDIKKFWKKFPELYNEKLKAISSGFLIESAWLKWYKIWWAFFSPLHANFLMSDWSATSSDMLELIKHAQDTVKNKFWIDIENEVRIINS